MIPFPFDARLKYNIPTCIRITWLTLTHTYLFHRYEHGSWSLWFQRVVLEQLAASTSTLCVEWWRYSQQDQTVRVVHLLDTHLYFDALERYFNHWMFMIKLSSFSCINKSIVLTKVLVVIWLNVKQSRHSPSTDIFLNKGEDYFILFWNLFKYQKLTVTR